MTKMPLAEDNNMVKAFPLDRTDHPFSICFALVSATTSVDHECPWIKLVDNRAARGGRIAR
jgi:hypothetical protein